MAALLSHVRFVWSLFGLVGASAFALLSLTISVDPYEAFGMRRTKGFNARKIDSGNDRLVKAGALRHGRYQSVLLGTSQAQFGLDPEHGALGNLPGKAYNAGLLRGSPYQLRRYLQAANHSGQVEKAILLVDLLMFNAKNAEERSAMGFVEGRLPVAADGSPREWAWLAEAGDLALSWSAVRLAVSTVRKQDRPELEWIFPSGLQNPRTVEAELLAQKGPKFAFEGAERRYGLWFKGFSLEKPGAKGKNSLSDFSDLVAYARSANIELTVAIAPTHARYVQMLWALDLSDQIDELKRQLSRRLQAEAAAGGFAVFPLWDFSAAHPLTTEEVPDEVGPRVRMARYYDSAHFTPKLGDVLLQRMAGRTPNGSEDFGVLLTTENIDEELLRFKRSHEAYAEAHAGDVADLRARIERAAAPEPAAEHSGTGR